ncbi:uncharacterized protein [Amphiura filiformis]|uniref:uncharacterized protein n=1 Tax=Amphiura filiformis TaxID=82378 RepID=UPI003B224951
MARESVFSNAGALNVTLYNSNELVEFPLPGVPQRRKRSPQLRISREVISEVIIQIFDGEPSLFTCEAWESNPAADINWFIDDVSKNENVISNNTNTTVVWNVGYPRNHYTYVTYSDFVLTPSILEHQDAILSCTASNLADPMGISDEIILDIIVLAQNLKVFINDVEVTNGSMVVIPDAQPAVFTCVVEGAKPAADCFLEEFGAPTLLSGTVRPNPTSELLFDTTALHEITPVLLEDDGRVWDFFAFNGYGDFTHFERFTITLEVEDVDAPIISDTPNNIFQNTDPDSATAVVVWMSPSASDNSGSVSLTSSHSPGDTFPIGLTEVTYTAIDSSNNMAETSFNITVTDQEAPVISCPEDIEEVARDGENVANISWSIPPVSDNSGGESIIPQLTAGQQPGSDFVLGEHSVTYLATDEAGNQNSCTFTVLVVDQEPPEMSCPDDIEERARDGENVASISWSIPSVSDNSGGESIILQLTEGQDPGSDFVIGNHSVTYLATDEAGNQNSCTFTVLVVDQEPPEMSCPDDIEERARDGENVASISWSIPSVSDNSGGESIILQLTEGQDPGSDFVIGNHSVTYLATDEAGNQNSCTFTVLVVDQEPPEMSCPDDIEERARDGENVASISWSIPSVSDNSGGESIILQLTEGQDPGSDFVIGNHSVTYLATDEAGNQNSCTFTVLVVDQEPPEMSCPDDIEERARDGENVASISWSIPSVSDNSGGESIILQLTEGQDPGSDFVIGNHSVTYLATDEAGNQNSCTFTVLVVDQEPPEMSCPDDIEERARDGENVANISWSIPSVSDNSGGESIILQLTEGQDPGSDFVIGNHSVTYLATDEAGNRNSCTFTVLVVDQEPPEMSCPDDIEERARDGENVASISWSIPLVSDNSGGESIIPQITAGQEPGSDFELGEHSVTYLATDEAGNQNSCTFIVLVVDREAPAFDCPLVPLAYQLPQGTTEIIVTWDDPLVSDNSGEQVQAEMQPVQIEKGGQLPAGTYNIPYIASDSAGNTATCELVIIVTDYPTLICPLDITVETAPGEPTASVFWEAPVITDGGDNRRIPDPDIPPGDFGIGTTQVVYDFEADGFSFYCTFSVIVEDREPPGISCPADIEERTRDGENVAIISWSIPSVSDNSGGESIIPQLTEGQEPGSDFELGEHAVTYLATDEAGNQNSCTFIVLVVDEEQPQLQCPDDITVETLETESMAAANWERIEADDNSGGGVIVTAEPPSGTRFEIGINSVSVIAVDSSNNEASCVFSVTVIDPWPPTIHCPGDLTQETDMGLDSSLIEWTITADDNSQDILIISGQLGSENTFPERESPINYEYSFPIGETRVTFEASDTSLNTVSCSFDVIVQDNELPEITCPEDILQATDPGVNTARVSWVTPEAFDNSYVVTVVTLQYSPGEEFYLTDSPILVMYQAVDGSGNTETCSFMIVLEDREIPRFINCPDDITETAAELASDAVVSWNPPRTKDNSNPYTSDDPPDGTTVIATMQPGDSFQLGVTQVNYTATDEAGNVAVCSFYVTVKGPDLPSISCPEDVISPTDSGTNKAVVLLLNQVSVTHPVENIQNIVIESDAPSGDEYFIGITEVTFTATDSSGNTDSCTVTVTVLDEEPPEFIQCPETIEQNLPDSGTSRVEITWTEPSVTDNSGIAPTISATRNSGDSFPVGEFTVEYVATDGTGNMGYCDFSIIVKEFVPTTTIKSTTTVLTTTMKATTTMITTKQPTTMVADPVDPCADNGPCPNDAICQVTEEVTCVCQNSGHVWNEANMECADIDECMDPRACPAKSQCDNTDGSYECICDVGFVLQGSASGRRSCADINECEDESHNDCDINAVCINNAGSFTCICKGESNFRGDGKSCEAVNPCDEAPCKNHGTCSEEDNDDGFVCECLRDQWMGRRCDIEIQPVGDPEVVSHPQSQTTDAFERVELTASFNNIEQIRWLHNSAPLSEFNDQSTLQIFRVAAGDEGYYHAVGIGPNGQVETEKALLQINDLGIFFASMTFNTPYEEETISQTEEELIDFLRNGFDASPRYSGDQRPEPLLDETSPGSVKARMRIYQYNITKTKYPDTRNVLVQALLDIAYNSNGYLDPDSIRVDSTVTCFESEWKSSYGPVIFPTSLVGEIVFSLEDCPWYTRNDGEPIAYAECSSDFVSPAVLVPSNNCGGNLTIDEQLAKLEALTVTPSNLQEVTREVEQLTSESNQVQADGVASVANILEQVVTLNSPDPEITTTVIETLDNLFNVDDEYLEMAQEQEGSVNKAVQAMETQLQNVQLSIDGSYRGNTENIVVEVREVMSEDFQRGVGFGSFYTTDSESIVNEDEVIMVLENSSAVASARANATALIILPVQLIEDANIRLGETDGMIRVTFVIYEEDTLFKSRTNKVFNDEQDEVDRAVNTRIVSCTVGNQVVTNLREPVEIAFKVLRNASDALNRSCVFWDFAADGGQGDWSSEGCYVSNTTGKTGDNVECKCNHLTNFAVLMDIYGQSTLTDTQDLILEILSYIGCGLSILGLVVTIYSYAAQKYVHTIFLVLL